MTYHLSKLGRKERQISVLDTRIKQLTMSLEVLKKERSDLQKDVNELRVQAIRQV